jgi:hypothetical protein
MVFNCITGVVMTPMKHVYQDGQKPKLLDQVRYAIRTKHYSIRTEEAYVQWIRRFILEFIPIYGILGLHGKEATAMGTLRFTDLRTRPTEVLAWTSLTVNELEPLASPFEAAFQAHMALWRLDGKPRLARRDTTDQNGPLPTPEDRLRFLLVSLQTSPRQVVHGRRFGMGQRQAHQWIPVRLVVLRAALRTLGETPTRSVAELALRLGVAEAAAAALVEAPEDSPPGGHRPAAAGARAASPLLGTMAPNGASSAPSLQLSRRAVIAASKSARRSNTSG